MSLGTETAEKSKAESGGRLPQEIPSATSPRPSHRQHRDDDDFLQARPLYRDVMTDAERDPLLANIVADVGAGVSEAVQQRVVAYWTSVAPELGTRVADGLTVGLAEGRSWDQSEAA